MSPIIDIQRRLVEVGRIRTGGRKPERGAGRKLEHWRLSSPDKTRLEEAAKLWGGKVEPWEAPNGAQFDLLTETAELSILLLPGQALSQWWEEWSGGGCKRRCDGERMVVPDDQPCACSTEDGERKCKPTTRLSVMLPDIAGLGCWRLESHGFYAAVELSATASMLEQATAQGQVFPARLRLEQRRKIEGGQTIRYAVPVLDIDVRLPEALMGLAGNGELPAGTYTPLKSIDPGVSVKDGLEIVESQTVTRTSRSAAPIPAADDLDFGGPVPVPEEPGGPPAPNEPDDGKVTADQKHALNALHGELTREKAITTEQVYAAAARMRGVDVDEMIVILDGRKQNGDLSFAKLRDSLTKQEASNLIDRLGKLADNVKAGAAA